MKILKVIVDEMPKSCMVCAYENHSSPFYTNPVCGILFKGIESIKERPSWCPLEVETGWIPVEEILPKDEKEVLVRTSAGKVSVDVKRELTDAEIEELGAQEAERKEFCPNCEAETPCTHEAELFVCDICGEDFAKYIVSRNCNVSDVTTPEPPEGA